jgi:hypothetical protein
VLFKITNAAITPGTQPQIVNIKTIKTDPQPLSKTASGGKSMESSTRNRLTRIFFSKIVKIEFFN